MENPTREKAELVLKMFEKEQTKAAAGVISAMVYDGMPKGSNAENGNENKNINLSESSKYCDSVKKGVELMKMFNTDYSKILEDIYIKYMSITQTVADLNIGRTTMYHYHHQALEKFAEICPDELYEMALNKVGTKSEQSRNTI